MEEKDLKNFEGLYTINTQGEVRRKETNIVLNYRWSKGSPFVRVSKEGKRKDVFIIPTLAEHFIPNPHRYKYTILKNKTAPITVENIEWSENKPLKEIPVGKIIKGFKILEDLGIQNKKRLVKTECTGCRKEYKYAFLGLKRKKNKFCGCRPDIVNLNNKYLKKKDNKKYIIGLTKEGSLKVKCKDCGEKTETTLLNYYSSHNSCKNCYLKEVRESNKVSEHPLYSKYSGIISRCNNESSPHYKYYGGKGIKLCKEWRDNFQNFYEWALSSGWEYGLTIERKDNSKDYCPDNCTWATMTEQNRNKSNVKLSLEKAKKIRESKKSPSDLAKDYDVDVNTIQEVLKNRTWV